MHPNDYSVKGLHATLFQFRLGFNCYYIVPRYFGMVWVQCSCDVYQTSRSYIFFEIMFSLHSHFYEIERVCAIGVAFHRCVASLLTASTPNPNVFAHFMFFFFVGRLFCAYVETWDQTFHFLLIFSLCMSRIKFLFCRKHWCVHEFGRPAAIQIVNSSRFYLFPFDMINRNECDEKFNVRIFQSELGFGRIC